MHGACQQPPRALLCYTDDHYSCKDGFASLVHARDLVVAMHTDQTGKQWLRRASEQCFTGQRPTYWKRMNMLTGLRRPGRGARRTRQRTTHSKNYPLRRDWCTTDSMFSVVVHREVVGGRAALD